MTYWCTYTKRGLQEYESFEEYVIPEEELPEVVIIDGRYIDVDRDLPAMQELTRKGVHLIFAKMPHITTMTASPEFCEFLGIGVCVTGRCWWRACTFLTVFCWAGRGSMPRI